MGVLTQHVGHHKGGQLGVGIGVEQAIVRQGVEGVTCLMLHEVQQRRVGMVGGCDGGDLVVFIPRSSPSTTAASALIGVALEKKEGGKNDHFKFATGQFVPSIFKKNKNIQQQQKKHRKLRGELRDRQTI